MASSSCEGGAGAGAGPSASLGTGSPARAAGTGVEGQSPDWEHLVQEMLAG